MKIDTVSISKINKYRTCPYWYHLDYNLEKDERPIRVSNPYLNKGSAFHEAMENMLLDYSKTQTWEVKKLHKLWEESSAKYGVSPAEIEKGKKVITVWSKRYTPPDRIIDVERRVEMDIENIPFVGIFDLVEEVYDDNKKILKITDWKTNAFAYSDIVMRDDLQAPTYILLAQKLYPEYDEYRFVFDFVFVNKEAKYEYDDEKINTVKNIMIGAYNVISKEKKPEPMPNPDCGWCPGAVFGLCPILKQIMQDGSFTEDHINALKKHVEDGYTFVLDDEFVRNCVIEDALLQSVEKIIKTRKGSNRDYIRNYMMKLDENSKEVGDYRVSFTPWEKKKYRPVDVFKAIRSHPELMGEVFDVKKTYVDEFIKSGMISTEDAEKIQENMKMLRTAPVLKLTNTTKRKLGKKKNNKKSTKEDTKFGW